MFTTAPAIGDFFVLSTQLDFTHLTLLDLVLALFLAFSIIATIVLMRRSKNVGQALLALLALPPLAGVIALFAFCMTTPLNRLPFSPPLQSDLWLGFLPALSTYTILAVAAHVVLLLLALYILFATWYAQLNLNEVNVYYVIVFGFIPTAALWEVGQWPLVLVLAFEGIVMLMISATFGVITQSIVQRLRRNVDFSGFLFKEQLSRIVNFVILITFFLGALAILAYHNINLSIVNYIALFLIFTLLDDAMASLQGINRPSQTSYYFQTPRRSVLSIPVALIVIILGSGGVFTPYIINTSLSSGLWLQAGTAAIAFMIFKPLTDLARHNAEVREETQQFDTRAQLQRLRLTLQPRQQAKKQVPETTLSLSQLSLVTPKLISTLSTESSLFQRLNFNSRVFFLVTGLGYAYLISNTHLSQVLNSGFVPLVFAITALVTSIIPLLNNPKLEPTREVSLLLLFIISLAAGSVQLFGSVLSHDQLTAFASVHMQLSLLSSDFPIVVTYTTLLQVLFLLTIAQLTYFYVLINTLIGLEMEGGSAGDLVATGAELFKNEEFEKADDLFNRALRMRNVDHQTQADAINGLGNIDFQAANSATRLAERLVRWRDARDHYEAALELDKTRDDIYVNKALACWRLRQLADVFAALEGALGCNRSAATLLLKGQYLNEMGRFEDAQRVLEEAQTLATDDITQTINITIALVATLLELKAFDEALQVVEATDKRLTVPRDQQRDPFIDANLMLLKGRIAQRKGDIPSALQAYQQTQKILSPEDKEGQALLWNYIAYAHKDMNDYLTAIEDIKKALELVPDSDEYHDSLGELYLLSGDAAKALVEFNTALSINDDRSDTWEKKAKALHTLGPTYATEAAAADARVNQYQARATAEQQVMASLIIA
jgi:tetratricopeptide (TPR) repeat protein